MKTLVYSQRLFLLTCLCFLLCGLSGCGYRSGYLIPGDIKTVAVRVASNETFWREAVKADNTESSMPAAASRPAFPMELDLSERIKNEIVRRTRLRLAGEDEADSILTASITHVKPSVLLRDASDDVLAERVTVSVDFVWQSIPDGRVIARMDGLSRPTDFLVARGESFTTATRKSFDSIAELIVEQMQVGF